MTPLRQKMIDAMRQRGFSIRTHQSYLGRSCEFRTLLQDAHSEQANADDAVRYFEYLVRERELSPSSCRVHWGALRFLYREGARSPCIDAQGGVAQTRAAIAGAPERRGCSCFGHRDR